MPPTIPLPSSPSTHVPPLPAIATQSPSPLPPPHPDSLSNLTFLDQCRFTIQVVPGMVGGGGGGDDHPLVMTLATHIQTHLARIDFRDISPFPGFSSETSAFKNLAWQQGSIRIRYVQERNPVISTSSPNLSSLLRPADTIVAVIGIIYCPSLTTSLSIAFTQFQEFVHHTLCPGLDVVLRVFALDITDTQLQETQLGETLRNGLEIFPPTTATVQDLNTPAYIFHAGVSMANVCSVLIQKQDELVKEAENAITTLQTHYINKTTSILGTSFRGSTPTTTPASPSTTATVPTVPIVKHPETCRIFSGAPSYVADQAPSFSPASSTSTSSSVVPTLLVTSSASQARKQTFRNLVARLYVWMGLHCLMVSSPLDAKEHLTQGVSMCKVCDDFVWEAIGCEALAACQVLSWKDGWMSTKPTRLFGDEVKNQEGNHPSHESDSNEDDDDDDDTAVIDDIVATCETALTIVFKHEKLETCRWLHAQISMRIAKLLLEVYTSDSTFTNEICLDKIAQIIAQARRVQANFPSISAVLSMGEANVWAISARHNRQRLASLMEASERFYEVKERVAALVAAEQAAAMVGICVFGGPHNNKKPPTTVMLMDGIYLRYPILTHLVTMCRDGFMETSKDRFVWYASQLLGVLQDTRRPDAADELLQELEGRHNPMQLVHVGHAFAPTAVRVDKLKPLPSQDSNPGFSSSTTATITTPVEDDGGDRDEQNASPFIYNPFNDGQGGDHLELSSPKSSSPRSSLNKFGLCWIEGERAMASLTLRNFSHHRSITVDIKVMGQEAAETLALGPLKKTTVILNNIVVRKTPLLVVDLCVAGAKFTVSCPTPRVLSAFPLLRWIGGNGVVNIGKMNAIVGVDDKSLVIPQGYVAMNLPPDVGDLTYRPFVRAEDEENNPFPDVPLDLKRVLRTPLPLIHQAKLVRCDTADFLHKDARAMAMLTLRPSVKHGSTAWIASNDNAVKISSFDGVKTMPYEGGVSTTALSPSSSSSMSDTPMIEMKIPLQHFPVGQFMAKSGTTLAAWTMGCKVAYASNAPYEWTFGSQLRITGNAANTDTVMDFYICEATFATSASRSQQSLMFDSEFVCFERKPQVTEAVAPQPELVMMNKDVVFCGQPKLETTISLQDLTGKFTHRCGIAFTRPGVFLIAWRIAVAPNYVWWWLEKKEIVVKPLVT